MDWLAQILGPVQAMGEGPFRIAVVIILFFGIKEMQKFRKECSTELGLLRGAVMKLHEKLSVIIERTASHEKRISKLERKKP
jgi:hypothetical protein